MADEVDRANEDTHRWCSIECRADWEKDFNRKLRA